MKKPKGVIRQRVRNAFNQLRTDGYIQQFACTIANIADESVHSAGNAKIMYDAIRSDYAPHLEDFQLDMALLLGGKDGLIYVRKLTDEEAYECDEPCKWCDGPCSAVELENDIVEYYGDYYHYGCAQEQIKEKGKL